MNDMASYINRGDSVFFQFRNGKSVLNSQCKPRMFKTAEKGTLGVNYIDTDEMVEYAEVVRCKDCIHYEIHKPNILENCERKGRLIPMKPDDFCSYGERRKDGDGNG